MKRYRIPVTYTATATINREVVAKSMQEAMFKLGQKFSTDPTPFDCVLHDSDAPVVAVVTTPGTPEIVDSQLSLVDSNENE